MDVYINGEKTHIPNSTVSIVELLKLNDVESPDMVSVQKNGEIIARESFQNTHVNENDQIEFLYFMGGGAAK